MTITNDPKQVDSIIARGVQSSIDAVEEAFRNAPEHPNPGPGGRVWHIANTDNGVELRWLYFPGDYRVPPAAISTPTQLKALEELCRVYRKRYQAPEPITSDAPFREHLSRIASSALPGVIVTSIWTQLGFFPEETAYCFRLQHGPYGQVIEVHCQKTWVHEQDNPTGAIEQTILKAIRQFTR